MGIFLKNYERKNWQQVIPLHLVWQEKNQTDRDLFVHFVPPLFSFKKGIPAVLVVNGEKRIPLSESHAVLVTELLYSLLSMPGMKHQEEGGALLLSAGSLEDAIFLAAARSSRLLHTKQEALGEQLAAMCKTVKAVADGKREPKETLDYMTYLPYYRAPYRAYLLMDETLSNGTWKRIMDRLVEAGVTKLLFGCAGEEEVPRKDLEDLLHFEKDVVCVVADKETPVSPLFDCLVDEKGNVLRQKDANPVGNLLEQPFYEIWQGAELLEERMQAAQ